MINRMGEKYNMSAGTDRQAAMNIPLVGCEEAVFCSYNMAERKRRMRTMHTMHTTLGRRLLKLRRILPGNQDEENE